MKIALIGYGKMGKAIEEIAMLNHHTIVLRISTANLHELTSENLKKADVAIEFSNPHSAVKNLKACFDAGVPVVCGSTGWLEHWQEINHYREASNGGLLYASNFSIGVNIFFEINKQLATLMNRQEDYDVMIEEIHHTQKKDAPSGTAITIAEDILRNLKRKQKWISGTGETKSDLSIISKRIDPAPGTHMVTYQSEIDSIEIKHTAHSRKGFAAGALMAAEFMINKTGNFTMKDILW
jgi:4-hydroxy-tetrahydrodipicolinate reductase